MVLVVMAAGLGSRFGGLKQLQPIDEQGNFLIDYSVYDAILSGFSEVIFVIRKQNLSLFKESIGNRIAKKIKVTYVFQENEEINKKYLRFASRSKPLGTGHVVYLLKNIIHEPFVVINADDFYGRESFMLIANFLKQNKDENQFGMVLFDVDSTLSPSGDVKRGVCKTNNGFLTDIEECKIERKDNKLFSTNLLSFENCFIEPETKVSMNLFGFTPKIFEFVDAAFFKFLNDSNIDPMNSEFFLPSVVSEAVKNNECFVRTIFSPSKWLGLTYFEDLDFVKAEILKLINKEIYPKNLWE